MPEPLVPGDGQDAIARFKRAREKRDPDKMLELFAEQAELRFDPFEPPLKGGNAIREYWNRIAAEQANVDFDAERVWVSGRTVLSNWHAAHTLHPSGDRIRVRGFLTMELDDAGLIARMKEWPLSRHVGTDSRYHPDDPVSTGSQQDG